MEHIFEKGDIVTHPTIGAELTVIRYLDNLTEAVLDHLLSHSASTDPYKVYSIVLCKWKENNKTKTGQFEQESLTLIRRYKEGY